MLGFAAQFAAACSGAPARGGLRRVGGGPRGSCPSPSHGPPSMVALEPGEWEWTCPDCGGVTRFAVSGVVCERVDLPGAAPSGGVRSTWRGVRR